MSSDTEPAIAVIIPCHNESSSIQAVITGFRQYLPSSTIYVYDNNSTDDTVAKAQSAGAVVRHENRQGKGFVVRRMFADIDADVYVLVDGDDTYDPSVSPRAVERLLSENLDMVNIVRNSTNSGAYRRGHAWGNVLLTYIVRLIFGRQIRDMLSGYRIFSRRYVKSFPVQSTGFEIETELTVHSMQLKMPMSEENAPYRSRAEGSSSKLSTIKDGFRILITIVHLTKDERPFFTFAIAALILFCVSMGLGLGVVLEFMETGLVPRFPTAIMAVGIMILSFLSFVTGLILDTVSRGRRELKHLFYLSLPAPGDASGPLPRKKL